MTRRVLSLVAPLCACLAACSEEEEPAWELPEIVASSQYIDYATWADTAAVCMDAKLEKWDQYIEQSAGFLGVAPPDEKTRYVWVPRRSEEPERWGCSETASGCYAVSDSLIFVRYPEMLHELAHAVEISALGRAHNILEEGMAELLSETMHAFFALDDFPEMFRDVVESGERLAGPEEYGLAMHFVGSVVRRHGMVKYREFREVLPHDGRVPEFAAAYEAVFGEDFVEAVEAMNAQPVTGLQITPGCVDDPTLETIPVAGSLTARVDGVCGDPHFHGFGFEAPIPGFEKQFVLDVEAAGDYELTVRGPHLDAGPLMVQLESCSQTEFVYMHVEAGNPDWDLGYGRLHAGRYSLRVYYPPRAEAVGEAEIKLELRNPI